MIDDDDKMQMDMCGEKKRVHSSLYFKGPSFGEGRKIL